MLNKNWKAIVACEHFHLKMLLATTEDEEVLRRLHIAFPELFSEDVPEFSRPIPLSGIVAFWEQLPPDTPEWVFFEGKEQNFATVAQKVFGLVVVRACEPQVGNDPIIFSQEEHDRVREFLAESEDVFPRRVDTFSLRSQSYFVVDVYCFPDFVSLIPAEQIDVTK